MPRIPSNFSVPNNSRKSATPPVPRRREQHFQPAEIYEAALAYRAAGFSFIPVAPTSAKVPYFKLLPRVRDPQSGRRRCTWRPFAERLPTEAQIERWFHPRYGHYAGLAIVCGAVSGGLEVVDFDCLKTFKAWRESLTHGDAVWYSKIVWVRSPRPGRHGYFRSDCCGGSQKLAVRQEPGREVPPRVTTLAEVKGERGLVLAPPSPGCCHPSGREYRFAAARDLTDVTTLTAAERERLFAAIRVFDERPQPTPRQRTPQLSLPRANYAPHGRPGDDFNLRGDWSKLLHDHGWELVGDGADDCAYWRRPGKTSGVSASLNYDGSDHLYVFSENAYPFDGQRSYSKFAAFALLAHGGDFHAAARELRDQGFGGGQAADLSLPSFADAYRDLGPLDF
jgi:hypothetical protein